VGSLSDVSVVTHANRLGVVIDALAQKPMSVSQLAFALRWPVSSVWLAVHELLRTGKATFHGYAPNPAPQGGRMQKLYRLVGWPPDARSLDVKEKLLIPATSSIGPARRSRGAPGSGVVAGRITIGRGSKWGAGLV
jgi:hypothetical protein